MEGSWNFGPELQDCISVRTVLDKMSNYWGQIQWKDVSFNEKVHEAGLLKLDCTKAKELLNWQPVWNVQQALEATTNWYQTYYDKNTLITLEQLNQYVQDARNKKNSWATIN